MIGGVFFLDHFSHQSLLLLFGQSNSIKEWVKQKLSMGEINSIWCTFSMFFHLRTILYTQKLGNFEEKQHIYYLPNIISDVGNKSTGVMHYAYIQ